MKIKNKILLIIVFVLIQLGCNNSSYDRKWNEASSLYELEDYDNCVVLLSSIIDDSKSDKYIVKSLFLLSEIYLNEFKEYYIAINYLDEILLNHNNSPLAKRALFTKAYVLSNYLELYSDAIFYYNDFLSKYPNDALASSVKYELEELSNYAEKIQDIIQAK
tara:strand:- start:71 stop:556 length:486 start_codon:yes stop_codon:yes gene_type:complete